MITNYPLPITHYQLPIPTDNISVQADNDISRLSPSALATL